MSAVSENARIVLDGNTTGRPVAMFGLNISFSKGLPDGARTSVPRINRRWAFSHRCANTTELTDTNRQSFCQFPRVQCAVCFLSPFSETAADNDSVLNTLPLLAFVVVFPDRFTGRVQHAVGCVCVCVCLLIWIITFERTLYKPRPVSQAPKRNYLWL